MGLDKHKKLIIEDNFNINPFDLENDKLSQLNYDSMPTKREDVMLDRHASTHYMVQYVLNKLLQNDKYIQNRINKKPILPDINNLSSSIDKKPTYDSITKYIDETTGLYAQAISHHMSEYHDSNNKDIYQLSSVAKEYLKNDMSNFDIKGARDEFQITNASDGYSLCDSKKIDISNDIVIQTEFNDSATVNSPLNNINVCVLNKKTGNQFKTTMTDVFSTLQTLPNLTDSTYIFKKWLSGFKELYIYIPTTYTFYNEHTEDQYGNEKPNDNATVIRVGINRRHFEFNNIYQAHICGQSLPMQIHVDKNPYFSDIVLPSMLRSMCISKDDSTSNTEIIYDRKTSMYYLYFVCYGTDAQAIRIFGD